MTPASQRFTAGPVTFIVKHELWDGNIHDHADQGVSIAVAADVVGKETALLRFNCFDQEKSYVYGPENPDLPIDGSTGLAGVYRMDPIADGNPTAGRSEPWRRSSRRCWREPGIRRLPRQPISQR